MLDEQARKIQSEMTATGKFRAISSNAALDRPEVIIEPDLDRLAELGISTATLSETLRVATIGDIDANLAKFTVGDRQIPIRVQLDEAGARRPVAWSARCRCRPPSGVIGAAVVGRRDPLRPGAVVDRTASTASAASSSAPTWRRAPSSATGLGIVWALPAVKNMPAGTRIQETGDAEVMGEVFAGFATAMSTGLMLVLVVLILLFGSVFHSFTILGSLPLAIGGVVGGAAGSPIRRSPCRWSSAS